jgi:hypothetical protein
LGRHPNNVEFVQQAVAQLQRIEDIERDSMEATHEWYELSGKVVGWSGGGVEGREA